MDRRSETWPAMMSLTPSPHTAVPQEMLTQWLRRHKYVPCIFQVLPNLPDAKTNEDNFRGLLRLLTEKNIVRVLLDPCSAHLVLTAFPVATSTRSLLGHHTPGPPRRIGC